LTIGPPEYAREIEATPRLLPEQRHDRELAPLPPYYPDIPAFRDAWARYNDLITEMDAWAGEFLAQLDEDGLAENTIVVFWSEHGVGMPRAKRWAYESGLREPLIVRWPGVIAPGQRRTELVYLMDLAPTMLEICGIPVPQYMHGHPFLDRSGRFLAPNEYVFGGRDRMDEAADTSRTVRDARYRYIRNLHPDRPLLQHLEYAEQFSTWRELRRLAKEESQQVALGRPRNLLTPLQRSLIAVPRPAEELYDLQQDPYETTNLAGDSAHREALERLRAALDEWIERYGDLGQLPEDELIERWRPGGRMQATEAPEVVQQDDGRVVATCATPGASIGWTTDPPGQAKPLNPLWDAIGMPDQDGRHWLLYTGPVEPPAAQAVWFRAWRLGYQPSDDVTVTGRDA
jgi:N-sulfoglucosamine sulfohydrolase